MIEVDVIVNSYILHGHSPFWTGVGGDLCSGWVLDAEWSMFFHIAQFTFGSSLFQYAVIAVTLPNAFAVSSHCVMRAIRALLIAACCSGIQNLDLASPDVLGSAPQERNERCSGAAAFVKRLNGHSSLVHAVSISSDGTRALTGSADRTSIVWDLSGDDPTTWRNLTTLTGHSSLVLAVSISSDGTRAVIGSADRTSIVWDLSGDDPTMWRNLKTLTGHSYAVIAVSISSDGTRAVTGSADQTSIVWDLSGDDPTTNQAFFCAHGRQHLERRHQGRDRERRLDVHRVGPEW